MIKTQKIDRDKIIGLLDEDKELLDMYFEHRDFWEDKVTATATSRPQKYSAVVEEANREEDEMRRFILELAKIPKKLVYQ